MTPIDYSHGGAKETTMAAHQTVGTTANGTHAASTTEPMPDAHVDRILASADMPSERALDPKDMREAMEWAEIAAESRMYGVTSKADAFMRVTTGRELGLSAATSLRLLYVTDGQGGKRIGMYAALMVALCLRRKEICEYIYCESSDVNGATYVTKRVGCPEQRLTFTAEDAVKAKLDKKDTYSAWGPRMFEARAASALARREYPDILAGIYDADELHDDVDAEADAGTRIGRPAVRPAVAAPAPAAAQSPSPATNGKPPAGKPVTGPAKGKPATSADQQTAALVRLEADMARVETENDVAATVASYKGAFTGEALARAKQIADYARARVKAAAAAAAPTSTCGTAQPPLGASDAWEP